MNFQLSVRSGNGRPHKTKKKCLDLSETRCHDYRITTTVSPATELEARAGLVGQSEEKRFIELGGSVRFPPKSKRFFSLPRMILKLLNPVLS